MPWATRVLLVNAANQANLTIGVVWSSTTSLPCGTKPAKSTSWTLEEGSLRNRQRTFKSSTKGSRCVLMLGKNIWIKNTVVQKFGRQNYFRSSEVAKIETWHYFNYTVTFYSHFSSIQVMQFGRIDNNAYTLDFQYPFTAVQAFAVALANVTQRLKWTKKLKLPT